VSKLEKAASPPVETALAEMENLVPGFTVVYCLALAFVGVDIAYRN
jgi:hypothetical protein